MQQPEEEQSQAGDGGETVSVSPPEGESPPRYRYRALLLGVVALVATVLAVLVALFSGAGQVCVEQMWAPTAPKPGDVTGAGIVSSVEVKATSPAGAQLAVVCYKQ